MILKKNNHIYTSVQARHFRAQPSTGETQESMNNVSSRRDMTEILLKVALNTIQSINH